MMGNKTITLDIDEYQELIAASKLLCILDICGIKKLKCYKEARRIFDEDPEWLYDEEDA